MLGNYKIRVNNEAESKEGQELFVKLGCFLGFVERLGMVCVCEGTVYTDRAEFFEEYDDCEEITLPQLRDMVSAHRNNADKSTPDYKQVIKYQSEDGMLFDTEEACVKYQSKCKLVNILEDNIYALRHEDGEEVLELMKEHKELFLDYLNNC